MSRTAPEIKRSLPLYFGQKSAYANHVGNRRTSMHKFGLYILALSAGFASACAPLESGAPKPLTDKQAKQLSKELDGKVASKAVNCISNSSGTDTIRVSDDILLYRVSGRLVYQNNLRGSCPGLARDDDIIVTQTYSGSTCEGDLITLVDRTSGIQGSVCSLGQFVPYKKVSG